MRLLINILVLIIFFSSCKEKVKPKTEIIKPETVKQVESTEKVDLSKIPDSLVLIVNRKLIGDFNGDEKMDFASMVKNKRSRETGVLIIHNSKNNEVFIFGAGKEINQKTDLNWIEIFKTIPKGEVVSPTLIDEESGDILGQDESRNFTLLGNGIYMDVEESHGGGIIFWNGKNYQWYQIE